MCRDPVWQVDIHTPPCDTCTLGWGCSEGWGCCCGHPTTSPSKFGGEGGEVQSPSDAKHWKYVISQGEVSWDWKGSI
jgi:hypothetical protein